MLMLTLEDVFMAKMTSSGSHYSMYTIHQRPSEDTSRNGNCRQGNRARSRGNQAQGERNDNRHGPHAGALNAYLPWSSPL